MWAAAKARAKKAEVPFGISPTDIVIPSHCPILGIPLFKRTGRQGGGPNSPSLDRIVPSEGYVWGNIVVISNRANRLKSDATIEEMQAMSDFYQFGIHSLKVATGRKPRVRKNPA